MKSEIIKSLHHIPNYPIIPFIEGDGIGVDITPVMCAVVNHAVQKCYGETKKIFWEEIFAGEKAFKKFGNYLPTDTIDAIKKHKIAIKGPMATPIGTGMRSLNVALRQELDLYVCMRPVQYITGIPSPVKHPELVDMIIFRENTEDIYAGIEWSKDSVEAKKIINFLQKEMGVSKIRFPNSSAIGIKPVSEQGSKRLIRDAINYAIKHNRKSVTLVHKGNIMKFTEGGFMNWGYELAKQEFNAELIDKGPWMKLPNGIIIKDVIADAFLQEIILHPNEYDVIATLNLNGDYISDALAAQVGGIGIAPGANLSDQYAVFEATHGTAPKHAGQNKVNPSSIILSAVMMLELMGWEQSAHLIKSALVKTIANKTVTYDFARMMANANQVSCSQFGQELINNM